MMRRGTLNRWIRYMLSFAIKMNYRNPPSSHTPPSTSHMMVDEVQKGEKIGEILMRRKIIYDKWKDFKENDYEW